MALEAGTKLGPYEILSPLGAGGMGEVYRARDSKLGREVAIKVLPEEFTQHPQKLARFEREARLLAALNHPGIATLYGVEEAENQPFLVMELVEGETLADRIARGALPVDEALKISQQIAEALEAAHDKGVIHRDLKPANIKVDPEGKVKVLDFGLAKAFADEVPESELSQSPTLSRDATRAGVILGTAAYMSPEQAKGKTVDKRTDIFSFGIVLFEMLTGKRAFSGEDVSDVLAAILRSEPDWKALPKEISPTLLKLLRRCLTKDRKNRLRDIGEARFGIEEIIAGPSEETAAPVSASTKHGISLGTAAVAALLFGAVAVLAVWSLKPEPERPLLRVVATPPSVPPLFNSFDVNVAITPDGSRIVYDGNVNGQHRLVVRALNQLEVTVLGVGNQARGPFISPDGNWVAYFDSSSTLQRISILGGPSETICVLPGGSPRGASWGMMAPSSSPPPAIPRMGYGVSQPAEVSQWS
jgi:serine/threonine protein kinase